MTADSTESKFMRPPSDEQHPPVYRRTPNYNPLYTFRLPPGRNRDYQQQYGDMYFLRLTKLKPAAEQAAAEAWDGFSIAGEYARRVDKVLNVRQGELSWVAGTVYMDMPFKPDVIEDVARDNYISAPPRIQSYQDPSNPSLTQIMLEDESGRVRLTGTLLRTTQLATGVVIAVLGTEDANGDFEVIDVKVPDLPRQPARWERDGPLQDKKSSTSKNKIAFVSGLGITGTSSDTLALELLTDYLLGYTGISTESSPPDPSTISRLIIAGNSLGSGATEAAASGADNDQLESKKKAGAKKYGHNASTYNASPITHFDSFLADLLPSIPITLLPGEFDPANFSLPQQGIHRAMLPRARAYAAGPPPTPDSEQQEPGWLDCVTNPWEGDVEGWRFWGTSGQNVDDVFRYLNTGNLDDQSNGNKKDDGDMEARMRIMEAMLRWRCGAPTAPDTLWCYPFQVDDPFVLKSCPHIFFAGNQPRFGTAVIEAELPLRVNAADEKSEMKDSTQTTPPRVRLLAIPKFHETGELLLVDSETLDVEVVKFAAFKGQEEKK